MNDILNVSFMLFDGAFVVVQWTPTSHEPAYYRAYYADVNASGLVQPTLHFDNLTSPVIETDGFGFGEYVHWVVPVDANGNEGPRSQAVYVDHSNTDSVEICRGTGAYLDLANGLGGII